MAHFESNTLLRPKKFNFATHVVDYWAKKDPPLQAMHWVSQDGQQESKLTYKHFSKQSHRVATMLKDLGVKRGDICIMIIPRIPEW
jgi:medium-chain acyl-CoA synthetase